MFADKVTIGNRLVNGNSGTNYKAVAAFKYQVGRTIPSPDDRGEQKATPAG